jgi:hypothetical protein
MKNIAVTVKDTACREARFRAAKRDTSVSAVVAYLLQNLPGFPLAKRVFPLENPALQHLRHRLPPMLKRKWSTPVPTFEASEYHLNPLNEHT